MNTAPLVIGHRGASGYRPEHSRGAYELAFTLGADLVEPDIVATKDGVLVLRHENEISGTTDVARHPEFAARRTTKVIDGVSLTGWFTEDFTFAELRTLRAIERLPQLRQQSSTFDGRGRILSLAQLVEIIDEASDRQGRPLGMVAEIKHATHFASLGLPLDELFAAEITGWAQRDRLVIESFEETVLHSIRDRGVPGRLVYLVEKGGRPADLVARDGRRAATYASQVTDAGLAGLADRVDGVSVDKRLIVDHETGAVSDIVARAHAAGLDIFTWTLRPENRFLAKPHRGRGGAAAWGDWRSEFRAIIGTGIDGVFADHPDLVRSALRP